jgi:hypothetical protein
MYHMTTQLFFHIFSEVESTSFELMLKKNLKGTSHI